MYETASATESFDVNIAEAFRDFFESHYPNLDQEVPDNEQNNAYSLTLSFDAIEKHDPDLSETLLKNPIPAVYNAEVSLHQLYDDHSVLSTAPVRFTDFPYEHTPIRETRADDINKFLQIEGIVSKATSVKPKLARVTFRCNNGHTTEKDQPLRNELEYPEICSGDDCDLSGGPRAFEVLVNQSKIINYQRLQVQEPPEDLSGGETPEDIEVTLKGDLTGTVKPGDRITILGILRAIHDEDAVLDEYVEGLNIHREDTEFEDIEITEEEENQIHEHSNDPEIYKKLASSIAPQIYGYEQEKLAIALQLFGGVRKQLEDDTKIRGDSHILLVGDPGTGKTVSGDTEIRLSDGSNIQIKKFVNKHLGEQTATKCQDGIYDTIKSPVAVKTVDSGEVTSGEIVGVWKREAPSKMTRITTESGKKMTVTDEHNFFIVSENGFLEPVPASELDEQSKITTVRDKTSKTSTTVENKIQETVTIPNIQNIIQETRQELHLEQSECGVPECIIKEIENGSREPQYNNFCKIIESFEKRLEDMKTILAFEESDFSWGLVSDIMTELHLTQAGMASLTNGISQSLISYHLRSNPEKSTYKSQHLGRVVKENISSTVQHTHERLLQLQALASGDISWESISNIETVNYDDNWVYDLQVAGTQNYVNNDGIISHNSQIVRYVHRLSPRGVYTSGKGSSSAGLTAAAVKDSDFGGGNDKWTLEAGAMVLADKGIAAVDELDKMEASDRSALHEAMEQQTVSVAKAGINATLKSRCSLLGAANPEEGRWDDFESIPSQINLEPALISRFDLIFAFEDEVDEDMDRDIASHILKTNQLGEFAVADEHELSKDEIVGVEEAEEESTAEIPPELFRKYVAYARKHVNPVLTDAARQKFQDFYTDLRTSVDDDEDAVPVTHRKLEGLVRLAEAAARVQLSDTIDENHAELAMEITKESMRQTGYDEEAGRFDVDKIEAGQSATTRDRKKSIRQIIQAICEEREDDLAPMDDIRDHAVGWDMDPDKVEKEVKKMAQNAEVVDPKNDGRFRLV